ncbi:ShlB/FhaC/HecB family hemolysin secretion/activation protein [Nostoc sphaeroides CHAB 2801]|uniref:ShlB/FhaC/HecB family hemolysin secretion/activation protein n=1 Tax=Nostoc sphaeroides TaxID=446679 RepID=UPI000E48D8AC|nr:ShlB/FhaC/HecB family hemolysin secretion/activation protein [Nostoc sphaeroides]MCC5627044.1 ShlB/FhaC/HecB family hemolysin secretion/activation protein [Nostoc sphaeroides CHAB 2801]
MPWPLESRTWYLFVVACGFSLAVPSPSYADSSTTSALLESSAQTLAQGTNPAGDRNQERFPQAAPSPEPLPPQTQPELQPTPAPETTPPPESATIQVEKIEVTGSTLFKPEQFNPITQPLVGRSVTLEELQQASDAITQLYLEKGYINSRAILVNPTNPGSVVEIRVIEGGIEQIQVQGTKRLNADYVRSRVALGISKPFSTAKLEEQLRLLRTDPLLSNVEASLRPGTGTGQSIVVVRVTETEPFNAAFTIDNYSPPAVGSERLGINASYRNLTGIGDELLASYYRTTRGGANLYDFSYRVPLNPMNGTLQIRTAINDNKVIQEPFDIFDIQGESQLYELSYRQPLVRTLRHEFALSLGFTIQNGQTFTFAGPTPFGFGPDQDGNSRTRVIKFAQDYLRRDAQGAWLFRSLFSLGIDALDATKNVDPIPDGQFFSWLGQVQRVQRLSSNNLLIAQGEIQLTPDGLLPAQQFVIGGGQSVRGYRQNVRAGDNGVRFAIESQITLEKNASGNPTLQLAPFFNLGYVWNIPDNPNNIPRQKFLAGIGVGVLWELIPRLNLRLDYGLPLVELDDRGNNAQDDGFYFNLGYQL